MLPAGLLPWLTQISVFLPFFLPSFLPFFLSSFLPFFLPSFLSLFYFLKQNNNKNKKDKNSLYYVFNYLK